MLSRGFAGHQGPQNPAFVVLHSVVPLTVAGVAEVAISESILAAAAPRSALRAAAKNVFTVTRELSGI